MEFPYECLTRAGGRAIIYTDTGADERKLVGAYESGAGLVPCAWLSTGRYLDVRFTGLDLLIYNEDQPRPKRYV